MNETSTREKLIAIIDEMSGEERLILWEQLEKRPPSERRKHPRKQYLTDVRYVGGDRIYKDFIRNISLGGLLIQTHEKRNALNLGQAVTLSVPFPKEKHYTRIIGEIVRISSQEIGIKFKKVINKEPL